MQVTVRYFKNGKTQKMAKRYAEVLEKMKRVEIISDEVKKPFPSSFQSQVVTKPITSEDKVEKKASPKKAEEKEVKKNPFPFAKKEENKDSNSGPTSENKE